MLKEHELIQFFEIGKSLTSEKDMVKLLDMVINSSITLTSSDAGTIYLVIDKETGRWSSVRNAECDNKLLKFVIAKNRSMDVKLVESVSPITKGSIFGYTVITGKSLRIDDAYSLSPDLEYGHDHNYDLSTGYITRSLLSIPMKDHEDNILGVIQLINKKTDKHKVINYTQEASLKNIIPFDLTDEMIMNSLAGQAAVALENNLLYMDMHDLLQNYKQQNEQLGLLSRKILKAHEEERKRISREIHDGPAQSVVNLSLKLELCKKLLENNMLERLPSAMGELSSSIKAASKEIRTIIYDLKPSYLEEGLIKALENHFNLFNENSGIEIKFTHSGDDSRIEYYLVSTIYRIAQEALTNVNKHAGASKVDIKLSISESFINLKISDNGKGFDASKRENQKHRSLEGGFGVDGMKERVELLKGDLRIDSRPGKGTCVSVNIPLASQIQ